MRWPSIWPISNSEHTSASSGYHGNTRNFGHVWFVKEALYFSEGTEYLETQSHTLTHTHAQTGTYCTHSPPTHHCDKIVTGAQWQRQCDSMWFIVSEKKVKEGNWGVRGGNKVCWCQRNFVRHHKTMMNSFMGGWRCQVKDKHHIITP